MKVKKLLKKKKIYGLVSEYSKIHNQHDAFLTGLRYQVQGLQPEKIKMFLMNWWKTAFQENLQLSERRTAQQIKIAIQYKLLLNGYKKNEVIPPKKFKLNCIRAINFTEGVSETGKMLSRCENYNELSKILITEGKKMIKKKKILKKKSTEEVKGTPVKEPILKKKVEKKIEQTDVKVDYSDVKVCKLLLQKKFTDEEIATKVKDFKITLIPKYRSKLNQILNEKIKKIKNN